MHLIAIEIVNSMSDFESHVKRDGSFGVHRHPEDGYEHVWVDVSSLITTVYCPMNFGDYPLDTQT